MNSEYKMVSCDRVLARIEDNFSSYNNAGTLDIGKMYHEIVWCINKFGIAAYELDEAVIKLENHKGELPCNYFLGDSFWLCDANPPMTLIIPQPNSKIVLYNREVREIIRQNTTCSNPSINLMNQGVVIESCPMTCNNEQVLEKVTAIDYIQSSTEPNIHCWHNPTLLTIRNKKSIKQFCSKDCRNQFAKSPYEISIEQQGNSYYIYSTLKTPIIYVKYYKYPLDEDTGLPLIPETPIIQKAIEFHLMHYFFYMAWLNNDDVNIERKVKDLEEKRDRYMAEAMNYMKIASFSHTIELIQRKRKLFRAYEIGFRGQHV